MKLYYYSGSVRNFGDALNPWLWSRLIPQLLDADESTLFVGIGTILTCEVPSATRTIVFGSGASTAPAPILDDTWEIRFVRGPLTARRLHLDPEAALIDGAVLLRNEVDPASQRPIRVGIMPHVASCERFDWNSVARHIDARFIDPRGEVDHVIQCIRESELVLTEALHGAIVADAMRVPWIPFRLTHSRRREQRMDFKWTDWFMAMKLDCNVHRVPKLSEWKAKVFRRAGIGNGEADRAIARWLTRIRREARPVLSRQRLFDEKLARAQEHLENLSQPRNTAATVVGG